MGEIYSKQRHTLRQTVSFEAATPTIRQYCEFMRSIREWELDHDGRTPSETTGDTPKAAAQTPRESDEEWVTYMQRATEVAERLAAEVGIEGWIPAQRRRKWRWGGHVLRLQDRRWTQLALSWVPDGRRIAGRPVHTWEHDFEDAFRKHVLAQTCQRPSEMEAAGR